MVVLIVVGNFNSHSSAHSRRLASSLTQSQLLSKLKMEYSSIFDVENLDIAIIFMTAWSLYGLFVLLMICNFNKRD